MAYNKAEPAHRPDRDRQQLFSTIRPRRPGTVSYTAKSAINYGGWDGQTRPYNAIRQS